VNSQFLTLFYDNYIQSKSSPIKTNVQQFFSHANVTSSKLFRTRREENENECKLQLCERAKFSCVRKKQKQKANFHEQVFPHRMFFFQLILDGAQRHIHFPRISISQTTHFIAQRISIFVDFS
jgi:hypothetical protein